LHPAPPVNIRLGGNWIKNEEITFLMTALKVLLFILQYFSSPSTQHYTI
jgi:hypothetical protein